MCGIGGYYNWKRDEPASREVLERMAWSMRHRGPDGFGYHLDGPLGLAHRRLAIIDLEGGHQPMSTPEGDLWISYNGEVYNYVELLDELRSYGHTPRTHSDTEAVILAYRQWGLDFASHLNGMFAIAIWDAKARSLVLCRDRLGIKPLYYADTPNGLAFASEIKALRAIDGIAREIDTESLDEYMTCGYVVHPRSMVRGVEKVEPGTIVTIRPDRGPSVHRYWQLAFRPEFGRREHEWAEEVRDLFTDSVRLQLRSDVPLGVLLSGGVDSTVIAATTAMLRGDPGEVDSFCVGVDVPGALTEFDWARQTAEGIGLRHHELRLGWKEYGDVLSESISMLDEPLCEPMVGQLLAVARLAREHVKVVLSGEGSDETWFGYPGYRVQYALELAQNLIPSPVQRRLVPVLDRVAGTVPMPSRLSKLMRLAAEPLERRYLGLNYFDTTLKNSIYSPALRAATEGRDSRESMRRLYDDAGGPEPLSRMAAVDCRAWLVDNTLLRSDLMSMATSLELRVPFLDHRLVELATHIPARFKVLPHDQKVILKRALADRLPPQVSKRRKVGFPTPLAELFRGDWGRHAEEVIASPSHVTEPFFDRPRLLAMMGEHRANKNDWSRVLFQVLMLETWSRALSETPATPPRGDHADTVSERPVQHSART